MLFPAVLYIPRFYNKLLGNSNEIIFLWCVRGIPRALRVGNTSVRFNDGTVKCSKLQCYIEEWSFRFTFIACRIQRDPQRIEIGGEGVGSSRFKAHRLWERCHRGKRRSADRDSERVPDVPGKLNFSISSLALAKHSPWPLTTKVFSDNWTAILVISAQTRRRKIKIQQIVLDTWIRQHFPIRLSPNVWSSEGNRIRQPQYTATNSELEFWEGHERNGNSRIPTVIKVWILCIQNLRLHLLKTLPRDCAEFFLERVWSNTPNSKVKDLQGITSKSQL
jgi:hypothetical protein